MFLLISQQLQDSPPCYIMSTLCCFSLSFKIKQRTCLKVVCKKHENSVVLSFAFIRFKMLLSILF